MKKMYLLLIVIIMIILSSCKKDDSPDYYSKPMFLNEAPKELAGNKTEVYVDVSDFQAAEYLGSRAIQSQFSYTDDYGNLIIQHYYNNLVLYKIKARRYWGWNNNIQYASTYKEEYQIDADQFAQIGEQLKNTAYLICYRCTLQDEENFFGLELKIYGIK